ncbi:hypothetical protein G4X40_01050 [Rhodococcus sp. D2-41]|uniref:DoxX family protein n=1 Tax=Speluncibacter jeojiensis TaxID=2710754 RepID=UPI00240EA7A0|nr:hypothetical protein [Rhodococcus sp. D2-41]MDG3008729.1 hypothetical protein [Rhodococcus sp. D2-41]
MNAPQIVARTGRDRATRAAIRLSALLLGAGTLHLVAPAPFDSIVPRALPGEPRLWTHASGVAELAVGTALAVPRTRRIGGLAAAALFVAVFPANVAMAAQWWRRPLPYRAVALGRLPLQVPLVTEALKVARTAR